MAWYMGEIVSKHVFICSKAGETCIHAQSIWKRVFMWSVFLWGHFLLQPTSPILPPKPAKYSQTHTTFDLTYYQNYTITHQILQW